MRYGCLAGSLMSEQARNTSCTDELALRIPSFCCSWNYVDPSFQGTLLESVSWSHDETTWYNGTVGIQNFVSREIHVSLFTGISSQGIN